MTVRFDQPLTERKTDNGSVATYSAQHGMPYFVAVEEDKPSGHHGEMRRVTEMSVRRVIRAPFERVDHESGQREIEEVQIGLQIEMIGPKRTNTAYGAIALRGDQIEQLIHALQEIQVAKSLRSAA